MASKRYKKLPTKTKELPSDNLEKLLKKTIEPLRLKVALAE